MFLLNNIDNRQYAAIYPGIQSVVFDLSDVQLKSQKNRDWFDIRKGSIACVVNSSRKISTFFRIVGPPMKTDVVDESGNLHIIAGSVIGRLPQDTDMTTLLKRYGVRHPYLPGNVFSIGFNVADLKDALDALPVKTKEGMKTLADLKRDA